MEKLRLACLTLSVVGLVTLCGCPGGLTPTGQEGNLLRVSFNPSGGNYAVAADAQGNQYTFRAREDASGGTAITEANIVTKDGKELKVSLDSAGRPVNVRLSDNTAADLVYDPATNQVAIRLTDAQGAVVSAARGIKTDTKKEFVRQRRLASLDKWSARAQAKSAKLQALQKGLETCEEVIESVCDPASNPTSPLANTDAGKKLAENAKSIGQVASTADVEEVADRDDLGADVTADKIPDKVKKLAGKTFKLFDAEGFCIEYTDVANILTFSSEGILLTEFDRHLVFPDLSLGGTQEAGLTINYQALSELNLTPDDIGFELKVQPIFTGTQVDEEGEITIERRFNADLKFPVELFGQATAEAHKLFDIAFINGKLTDNDSILELELILVDLDKGEGDTVGEAVIELGKLRYHDQNVPQPKRIYACEVDVEKQAEGDAGIECPTETVQVGDEFTVRFDPGSADSSNYQYDWFVSDGAGYISGEDDAEETTVVGTKKGFLEVTLLVHDLSDPVKQTLQVYSCTVNVGQESSSSAVGQDELVGYCPIQFGVGVPGEVLVTGTLVDGKATNGELVDFEWLVLGAWSYYIDNQYAPRTMITFYEPGNFTVVFEGWTDDGDYVYLWQDVTVVTGGGTQWGGGGPPTWQSELAGDYQGALTNPSGWAHTFAFTIDEDGTLSGISLWGAGTFELWGYVDEDGYIYFEDDADMLGYALGIYEGYWDTDEQEFIGMYYEGDFDNEIGLWSASPVAGGS